MSGRRRKKENRSSWHVLEQNCDESLISASESSGEEDEVWRIEHEGSSEIESEGRKSEVSSADSAVEQTKTRKGKVPAKQKPRASTSNDTGESKKQGNKTRLLRTNKSISEDEIEDLGGMLEVKREELDQKIKHKMESSVNLAFYQSRAALKNALLANESVLSELTDDFVDELIEVVKEVFSSRTGATDKKAFLAHAW